MTFQRWWGSTVRVSHRCVGFGLEQNRPCNRKRRKPSPAPSRSCPPGSRRLCLQKHSRLSVCSRQLPLGHSLACVLLVVVLGCSIAAGGAGDGEGEGCTQDSPLVGFQADLSMNQHQLRGRVEVLDDCTFKVVKFDLLPGREVYWWGARSESLLDMLHGFKISPHPLVGTYNTQTLLVSLVNATWDDIKVISVWCTTTASDYGHLLLQVPAVAPAPAPAPSPPSGDLAPSPGTPGGHRKVASPPPDTVPSSDSGGPSKMGAAQPTMLQGCMQLSHLFRVRWTLNEAQGTVDVALEAAVSPKQYLAFGWADPKAEDRLMISADMIVAGLNDLGMPFAEDYSATDYVECNFDKTEPEGVCPDTVLGGNETLNDVELLYGHRVDGITFIRFRRKLASSDVEFDHPISAQSEMNVIWAHGPLRPQLPGSKTPRKVPTFHGTPQGSAYGVAVLTLDSQVDDCQSVLAPPTPDLGPVVVADRGSSLPITSGASQHFPNPPNPNRTLFIKEHEAPVLKVERGVPVELSVQAGHDMPLYVTTDPVGGNFDPEAEIFAGGPDAHGVPAVPYIVEWTPNSTTPDLVFYQSYSQPKVGWMVQVVDGGLSDMYSNSVLLAGNMVTFFWTLTPTEISVAIRAEHPSGYLAIAFGSGMVNAWAYVGWRGEEGEAGKVASYWMDSREPSGVHEWADNFTSTKCATNDGIITFEFSRPLKPPSCALKCNVINPAVPVKVVWAYGTSWTTGELSLSNMHTSWSSQATVINLLTGEGQLENLQPVFAVHGFMMFLAWGILIPFGILAARYLKHSDWFQIHLYTQWSAISVMLLGLLFAVGELQGFDFSSAHAKIGLATFLFGLWQPLNGYFRPAKSPPGERQRWQRVVWQWTHMLSGRCAVAVGFAALLTGVISLGDKGGDDYTVDGLLWAMVGWFATMGALVWFIERNRRTERSPSHSLVGLVQQEWNGNQNDGPSQADPEDSEDDTRNLLAHEPEQNSNGGPSKSRLPVNTAPSDSVNGNSDVETGPRPK